MKRLIFIILITCSYSLFAESFVIGSGSEFELSQPGIKQSTALNIYISESSFTKLGVEYYFQSSESLLGKKMWQQYNFKVVPNKPLEIQSGFVKEGIGQPVKSMKDDAFTLNRNGVQIEQFLFSNLKELEPFKIANEKIETLAGNVQATHYRKKNKGQTVDFWISEKVKPIGLVKLISTSPTEKKNNYKLELKSLLKNVKKTIYQP